MLRAHCTPIAELLHPAFAELDRGLTTTIGHPGERIPTRTAKGNRVSETTARGRSVIVVDASVLANAIADDEAGDLARDEIGQRGHVSAAGVDVETVAVLRKRWLAGTLPARRFASSVRDLEELAIDGYPTLRLMWRAYELRDNVTVYDAAYVALAEALDCPLVTADARLAQAPEIRCGSSWSRTRDDGLFAHGSLTNVTRQADTGRRQPSRQPGIPCTQRHRTGLDVTWWRKPNGLMTRRLVPPDRRVFSGSPD